MAPAMYSTKVQGAVENPAVSVGAVENPDVSVGAVENVVNAIVIGAFDAIGAVENSDVIVGVENPDGSVSHGSVSPANCPRGGRRSRTAIVRLSLEKEDDEFVKFDVPVDNDYKSLVFRPGKYL